MAKRFLTPVTVTVSTGTAPFIVSSTTVVTNLNADLLDGQHGSYYAPKASPALTGTPTAPTASAATNTTQIATTAYVKSQGYTTNTGTVTSVNMSTPTGLSISGNPITSSGTLALSLTAGYEIPQSSSIVHIAGTETITGAKTFSGGATFSTTINSFSGSSRDHVRVWNSSEYAIGMQTAFTFGGLANGYAMTFQMNNDSTRGFWWGDSAHAQTQGAMALTTDGKLTVATAARIGFGESDTTIPGTNYVLEVNGSFAATSKSFVIDHPTKPNMKLRYGSLEGPENGVYVRGKSSSSTITLPDYWTGLVDPDSITVQVTPIGKHKNLYVKDISDNTVTIGGVQGEFEFFYFIQAERIDVDKLVVEYGS